jgi:hypothetical protein
MTGSKVLITALGGDGERDELRLIDIVSYRESNWLVPSTAFPWNDSYHAGTVIL